MKKNVSLALSALAFLGIAYSVFVICNSFSSFIGMIFHANSSVEHNRSVYMLEASLPGWIFFILLIAGSIGVLKKQKWGLYCIRTLFILSFLILISVSISILRVHPVVFDQYVAKEPAMMNKIEMLPIKMLVFEMFLLIFLFLPAVKNLFTKQPLTPTAE